MAVEKLSPDEELPNLHGATVGEFWSWAYSDVQNNTDRAVFAEFLVGSALGVTDGVSAGWGDFDLLYRDKKIEVKSSAYLQSVSWGERRLSRISFDIKERVSLGNRAADCYVFCVHAEKNRAKANVLDAGQWQFYVLSTKRINAELDKQKSAALSTIQRLTECVGYARLRGLIDLSLGFTIRT